MCSDILRSWDCYPSSHTSKWTFVGRTDMSSVSSHLNLLALLPAGGKVISRKLSLDNLAEVECVLQRPPLIWDNLHANDYDSRRLFLGPFKGREPQLRSHLSGLLLNPNCEFEANYIPLHSLGSWFRTGNDESKGERKGSQVYQVLFLWLFPFRPHLVARQQHKSYSPHGNVKC